MILLYKKRGIGGYGNVGGEKITNFADNPLLIKVSLLIHKFPKKSVTNGVGHGLVYIES